MCVAHAWNVKCDDCQTCDVKCNVLHSSCYQNILPAVMRFYLNISNVMREMYNLISEHSFKCFNSIEFFSVFLILDFVNVFCFFLLLPNCNESNVWASERFMLEGLSRGEKHSQNHLLTQIIANIYQTEIVIEVRESLEYRECVFQTSRYSTQQWFHVRYENCSQYLRCYVLGD